MQFRSAVIAALEEQRRATYREANPEYVRLVGHIDNELSRGKLGPASDWLASLERRFPTAPDSEALKGRLQAAQIEQTRTRASEFASWLKDIARHGYIEEAIDRLQQQRGILTTEQADQARQAIEEICSELLSAGKSLKSVQHSQGNRTLVFEGGWYVGYRPLDA
jgi:hypothetical protein